MNVMDLDFGKHFGFFQGMLKLQLGFLVRSADRNFHFGAIADLMRFDTDDVNASRAEMLEVHKHERPIEAAGIEKGVDKVDSVLKIGDFFLMKEILELALLGLNLGP